MENDEYFLIKRYRKYTENQLRLLAGKPETPPNILNVVNIVLERYYGGEKELEAERFDIVVPESELIKDIEAKRVEKIKRDAESKVRRLGKMEERAEKRRLERLRTHTERKITQEINKKKRKNKAAYDKRKRLAAEAEAFENHHEEKKLPKPSKKFKDKKKRITKKKQKQFEPRWSKGVYLNLTIPTPEEKNPIERIVGKVVGVKHIIVYTLATQRHGDLRRTENSLEMTNKKGTQTPIEGNKWKKL